MNYCALEDAYQEIGGAPSPGCAMDTATKAARKEERRKARRCKGPAATYLDIPSQDMDRQSFRPMPDVSAMNQSTGLREHASVTEEAFTQESMIDETYTHRSNHPENTSPVSSPEYDKDPLHNYVVNEQRAQIMTVPVSTDQFSTKKKFFGADPDGDAFADYVPDQENYRLQPDFLTAFEHAGVAKAGSMSKVGMGSKMPPPSANMYWKPLTPSGTQTSFIESPSQHKYYPDAKHGGISNAEIMKKIDKIFARLDDLNAASSPEQIHSELLMFISSGIFVLFMMDLLVKKGSTLRF